MMAHVLLRVPECHTVAVVPFRGSSVLVRPAQLGKHGEEHAVEQTCH